jgi:hypothetical protein
LAPPLALALPLPLALALALALALTLTLTLTRSDIDSSAFIVETQVPGAQHVPLSQGSHFFQNLLSFGLGYATVDPARGELADYEYWDSLPQEASSTELVKHVRLGAPLEIIVDGMSRRGVVMKADKPFEVYVGQVDALSTRTLTLTLALTLALALTLTPALTLALTLALALALALALILALILTLTWGRSTPSWPSRRPTRERSDQTPAKRNRPSNLCWSPGMWRVPCSLDGCRRGCSVWPPCARVAARRGREQPLLSFREGRRSTQVRPLPKGPVLYFRRTHVPRRRVVHRDTKNQKKKVCSAFFHLRRA